MKASIIIPTLNEADLLPDLLAMLDSQTERDFEVIIADGGSTDDTQVIAKAGGARVTAGGSPAAGRNKGAAIARGNFLFFLDADVKLPNHFMAKALSEMESAGWELATAWFEPDSDNLLDAVLFNLANLFVKVNLRTDPHAAGFAIFVKRSLFEAVGGFDESLHLAEDHDFVKRATQYAPLEMLSTTRIRVSVRRLEKEGRISYAGKCIEVELHRLFRGELDREVVEYDFAAFDDETKSELERRLEGFMMRLSELDRSYTDAVDRMLTASRTEAQQSAQKLLTLKSRLLDLRDRIRESLLTGKH
jgi:hypothetical protein